MDQLRVSIQTINSEGVKRFNKETARAEVKVANLSLTFSNDGIETKEKAEIKSLVMYIRLRTALQVFI